MDDQQKGALTFAVFSGLVLVLVEIQATPVFSAPSSHLTSSKHMDLTSSKHMDLTIDGLRLLQRETDELFKEYNKFHGDRNGSVPAEVPDVSLSGVSAEEKLQSIYSKTIVFSQHLQQVQLYHKEKFENKEPLAQSLTHVSNRCGYLVSNVQHLLKEPSPAAPPTPPPLTVVHSSRFSIRVYGWAVLLRLQQWLTEVEQVLLTLKEHAPFLHKSILKI